MKKAKLFLTPAKNNHLDVCLKNINVLTKENEKIWFIKLNTCFSLISESFNNNVLWIKNKNKKILIILLFFSPKINKEILMPTQINDIQTRNTTN